MTTKKDSKTNIWTEALVIETTLADGLKQYTVEFDGTIISMEHNPTESELHLFKKGVLAERERIWDEGLSIDDSVLRKLLKH